MQLSSQRWCAATLREQFTRLVIATVWMPALAVTSFAQSDPALRNNVSYKCAGETIVVTGCRHDSDTPGFRPTTAQEDYCAVQYPSRPLRHGLMVETVELRADVIRKLQACGALPRSARPSTPSADVSTPTPAASSSTTSADAYIKQAEPYFNGKGAAKAEIRNSRMNWAGCTRTALAALR